MLELDKEKNFQKLQIVICMMYLKIIFFRSSKSHRNSQINLSLKKIWAQ